MEESDLLKERIHAITEKRRVQEDIRQKKQELDREKLKLQHLKKKALREQWLLQDSASHNALQQQQRLLADQQQTRALQINIHRIEREVECLEREESMISTNESFILKRLKAVEKSPEEIIKEAQDNFIPEPIQVATVIPDLPESLSPPAPTHTEPDTPRHTLFAMEINVAKNLLTGESKVVSTAAVSPQELNQHTGVKVYDDGRKCVYALEAQQGSHDKGCVSELSANEVERLLRDATQHRHGNPNHQNHSRKEGHCYGNHQEERHQGERQLHRNQGEGHYHGNHHIRNNLGEEDRCYSNHRKKNWQRKQGEGHHYGDRTSQYSSQKERNYHSNQRESHHLRNHQGEGHHHGNRDDHHYSLYQERNCHSSQGYQHGNHHANGILRSSSRMNGGRVNSCPPPRSHDQEVVSAYQPELCYTPTNHIPLSDYISVEEEELYFYNPAPYHSYSQSENGHSGDNQSTALYRGPAQSDRAPSPIYEADAPYTILSAMEATEPITAVFLGFQTTQDESGRGQEYEGSIKAELVIIDDNDDDCDDNKMKEGKSHTQFGVHGYPAGHSANGNTGHVETGGDTRTERRMGPVTAVQMRSEEEFQTI